MYLSYVLTYMEIFLIVKLNRAWYVFLHYLYMRMYMYACNTLFLL